MKLKKIGILSIQGGIKEHYDILNSIEGVIPVLVKKPKDLKNINGIIIPGGESTAVGKLLRVFDLLYPLSQSISQGLPTWGTCAGMVLLAKRILNENIVHLGVMNILVKRNGYGSQNNSFDLQQVIPSVSSKPLPLIFIRAPYVEKIYSSSVKTLSTYDNKIIACCENNMLATSFHPELTNDTSFHKYFLDTFF